MCLPAIVVGVDHSIGAIASDVVDGTRVVVKVRILNIRSDGSNRHTFHHERHAEEIKALANEGLEMLAYGIVVGQFISSYRDRGIAREVEVFTPCPRNSSAKLSDGFTNTEKLQGCRGWCSSKRSSRPK